ncbi:MAG: hypothetical protein JWM34_5051 [Ilumatobacteraceae bacterium]|nr:hypothetical protein [Ilumatobacteraceae bacterium]
MDDIEQIKQLKARYFRMMDTKDWDGLQAVFTADVHIDMMAEGGRVLDSAADYLPWLRSNIEAVTTVHHGHMPEITMEGPDRATGIWAMEDELWWPEGSPLKHMHGYGHYHETYARTADGWKIAAMTLTRLHRDLEFA